MSFFHGSSRPLLRSTRLVQRCIAFGGRGSRGPKNSKGLQSSSTRGGGIRAGSSSAANSGAGSNMPRSSWWKMSAYLSVSACIGALLGSGVTLLLRDKENREQIERQRAAVKAKNLHAMAQQGLGAVQQNVTGEAVPGSGSQESMNAVENVEWFNEISDERGAKKVLTAEDLLAQEHPFLEDDHMVRLFLLTFQQKNADELHSIFKF